MFYTLHQNSITRLWEILFQGRVIRAYETEEFARKMRFRMNMDAMRRGFAKPAE